MSFVWIFIIILIGIFVYQSYQTATLGGWYLGVETPRAVWKDILYVSSFVLVFVLWTPIIVMSVFGIVI